MLNLIQRQLQHQELLLLSLKSLNTFLINVFLLGDIVSINTTITFTKNQYSSSFISLQSF